MKRTFQLLCLGSLLAFIAGCASPESRIKQNPDMFASFPPDIQVNVKQGKIDVGYTKDMVFIALGSPDRKYVRTTSAGQSEVWAYIGTYSTIEHERITSPFSIRDPNGGYRTITDTVWVDVQRDREYEKLRVEFQDNVVKAIERSEK